MSETTKNQRVTYLNKLEKTKMKQFKLSQTPAQIIPDFLCVKTVQMSV